MKMHERTHTGERPFQCKYCKKGFVNSSNLKAHETVHTGERPFQCKYCNKDFASLSNLIKHERREKPQLENGKLVKKVFLNRAI